MSAELEYNRVRNTYYYQLSSKQGQLRAEAFDFNFHIPPFRYKEHNDSDRCIFTLQGVVCGDQIVGQQIGQSSYFTLQIDGIGLIGQNFNTTVSQVGGAGANARQMDTTEMNGTNSFLIPNTMEQYDSTSTAVAGPNVGDIFNNVVAQHLTGTFDLKNPYVLICSNPVGKTINFRIRSQLGQFLADNVNIQTIVRFKIEIIPKD